VHDVLWKNKMDRRSRIIWFAVERIFDSRRIVDIVAVTTFTAYSVHSQRMPISTTPQIEVTVSQSDWHKVGSVDGRSINRRSRNWRSKMHGKTKHSWSTINSEHKLIEDQLIGDQIWFDWRWKNRTLVTYSTAAVHCERCLKKLRP